MARDAALLHVGGAVAERDEPMQGHGHGTGAEDPQRHRPPSASGGAGADQEVLDPKDGAHEAWRDAPGTPDAQERPESSSPRFSYANNHSSGKAHLRGNSMRREELLEKVLGGEVWGETMVRMELHAGKSTSGQWRRFDELLRDSEAVSTYLAMTLGQLCAAGYGAEADSNNLQSPATQRSVSTSPADADQVGRRRAMSSIASSLTRHLFAKNFARSDLIGSPVPVDNSGSGDVCDVEPVTSASTTPRTTDATAPPITAHTPSIPFMQESNVPSAPTESTRGATRLPAVGGARIEAFRELSGAGSRKLGYIASAVSSQLAAVGSAAASSASSATAQTASKGQSAAAARAALISASTGLDYSPTTRGDKACTA